MKFTKLFSAVAIGLLAVVATASAQLGFDTFGVPRAVVLAAPQNLNTIGTGLVTNGPIDHIAFAGRSVIQILSITNSGATTLTAQVFTSPDTTNLTALSNFALINSTTSISLTNLTYGTNTGSGLVVANSVLLPGTITTPNAASAGYATPYLSTLAFTNAGTVNIATTGYTEIGFNVSDLARYIYVKFAIGGGAGATNATVGATFISTPVIGPTLD